MAKLPRDRWLLASLLQKAVRRGHAEYAAAAAYVLGELVPEYVAARLPVIAYEDVGVGAPALLVWAKQAAASLPFLPPDDQKVSAAAIARQLAVSIKSRTACDLLYLVETSEEAKRHAHELLRGTVSDWLTEAVDRSGPVIRRAAALWFTLGTSVQGNRPPRQQQRSACRTLASALDLPASLIAATVAGRATHNLNVALPLAYDLVHAGAGAKLSEHRRSSTREAECQGVLLCGMDMYTRVGRAAYASLVRTNAALAHRLNSTNDRDLANTLGVLLFHAEGSVLDRALVSAASQQVRCLAEALEARVAGIADEGKANAIKRWLLRNIDAVNECRTTTLSKHLGESATW